MLGYSYRPGYLDNPKNHRNRCSLLLRGPEGNVLVDCPPEMRLQLTGEKVTDLEAVIITHTHADHVMGMDDLRSICILRGKAMPIYTLPEYRADICRIYPYAFLDAPEGLSFPRFELRDMPDTLVAAGLKIESLIVDHGPMRVIGLRVGQLAYLTDVSHVSLGVEERMQGLTTLILDALRRRPHPNHFNLEQALEFADRIGAKQTFLTHLTHDFDHDVTEAELPAGVKLAYDGMRVTFE